jgi:hypothetical protein
MVFPTFIHISLQGTYYAVINSYCHLSLTSFTNSYVQHNTTQHNTPHTTHKHTDTQTHRHTDTQTHRHTDTQTHRHTDTQTHKYTNTQTQHRSLDLRLNKVALEFYG